MMAHPIVYGPAISTYVWSARLALAEKGVTHELVDVPFGNHREEPHLSRQPFAKVPAFEHDGFALYETQAIMRYVDERFAGTPLQPEDVHELSRMNQIIGIVDAYAWPSIVGTILFNRILVPRFLGGTPDEAAIAAALPRARLCLAEIDRLMEDHRFLAADFVSLADLMVIPLLYYFSNVPDGRAPMADAPEIAELGPPHGNSPELSSNQAAASLTSRARIAVPCGDPHRTGFATGRRPSVRAAE
jgi:glutathione S-transferase